jgi:TetR/AcrR family transcriptional regulator, regulator of autoinduction and epiphytic fitness
MDVVDGRRLRRQQNREAVLDALVSLFEEGAFHPTTDEIAERAGLSPRSLFRYFTDVDDLAQAAIEREITVSQRLLEQVDVEPDAPVAERVERFVAARVRLFESIAPTARAARVAATRNDVIRRRLRERRALLRAQVVELLAPPAAMVPAIDALCSFESYELLRHDQRLSKAKATAALVAAVEALMHA